MTASVARSLALASSLADASLPFRRARGVLADARAYRAERLASALSRAAYHGMNPETIVISLADAVAELRAAMTDDDGTDAGKDDAR